MIKTLIVSFLGASRTGFTYSAVPARCEPHRLFILRCEPHGLLSFAEPSLEQKINKGCTMGFISYLCG